MKSPKIRPVLAVAALWAGLAECAWAARQEPVLHFRDAAAQFSLDYPNEFEEVKPNYPHAALLLRSRNGNLPSINVLALSGAYRFEEEPGRQAEAILHSYRRVGFTDAQIVSFRVVPRAGQALALAEVTFMQQGRSLCSRVAVFSGPAEHFIITFLAETALYQGQIRWFDIVVDSFQAPDLAPYREPPGSHPHSAVLLAGAAAALAITAVLLRRQA